MLVCALLRALTGDAWNWRRLVDLLLCAIDDLSLHERHWYDLGDDMVVVVNARNDVSSGRLT